MKLDTVRNFINFNYENNPNLEFITCSTSQKKTKKKFFDLYPYRKFVKWYSAYAWNYVFWNDPGSS